METNQETNESTNGGKSIFATSVYSGALCAAGVAIFGWLYYPDIQIAETAIAGIGAGIWGAIIYGLAMYATLRLVEYARSTQGEAP